MCQALLDVYLIKLFQQMFIEHLTHARHCSKCWGYSSELNRQNPDLLGAEILLGER